MTRTIADRLRNYGRPDNSITDRIDIYGPATCPIDGNYMETIWGRQGREGLDLVCRNHPGHPLHRP